VKTLILYCLRFYKRYLSPLCPPACRFVPTCSEYAIEAFEKKKTLTAVRLTVARIAKCHPWHPGGYDPVK
jgi:putative membrane protein insertion efficiency factor